MDSSLMPFPISARMNERGEGVWADFSLPRRPIGLGDVVVALFSEPRPSSGHDEFCDGLPIYSFGPCSCEELRNIRALNRPHMAAERIQSLWRGYSTRKSIQERNAEEIASAEPIWRIYDEDYNRSVLCQNLLCELKKDDPTWDATQTRHYQWMLKTGGPLLEEYETYMLRRGWVRPQKKNIHVGFTLRALYNTLKECGVSDTEPRALFAIVKALESTQ
jgi:hypothetical protein